MLTILITSYNHADFIVAAIESARRINVFGAKIIIVDDASTDNTRQVLAAYKNKHFAENITYLEKPVNRGVVDSLNMVISTCDTEYIYFLASDDIANPEGLERIIETMEGDSNLKFVIGGGTNLFADQRHSSVYNKKHEAFFDQQGDDFKRAVFWDFPSPILCQSTIFRVSALKDVGGFDSELIADDFAIFTKLFLRYPNCGRDFFFLPEINCVTYRHHANNTYKNLLRQAIAERQVLSKFAPTDLLEKLVAHKLAFFFLLAIRKKKLADALKILSLLSIGQTPYFGCSILVHIFQKAKKL